MDVIASAEHVFVRCDNQFVAAERTWAKRLVVTDPDHQRTAALLRQSLSETVSGARDADTTSMGIRWRYERYQTTTPSSASISTTPQPSRGPARDPN